VTDVRLTQEAIEQWARSTPNAQLTQIGLEQWASITTVPTQVALTQIAIEQWAPPVSAVRNGPIVTMIG
jgi:hypothetical protein